MEEKEKTVSRIREFNRFYMPTLDLLDSHYLDSEYSAAEARVLFEVYGADGCNAAHISGAMNLDKSYLSRIIKKHEASGYLTPYAVPKGFPVLGASSDREGAGAYRGFHPEIEPADRGDHRAAG